MRDEIERIPNDECHAFVVLDGVEHQDWIESMVDPVEWTDPFYGHQN